MKYTVKIEKSHIKRGRKNSDTCNPVALAILEATSLPGWIVRYGRAVRFNSGDYAVLPGFIEKWLIKFDSEGESAVGPTEFILKVS